MVLIIIDKSDIIGKYKNYVGDMGLFEVQVVMIMVWIKYLIEYFKVY